MSRRRDNWITLDTANVSSRIKEGKIKIEDLLLLIFASRLADFEKNVLVILLSSKNTERWRAEFLVKDIKDYKALFKKFRVKLEHQYINDFYEKIAEIGTEYFQRYFTNIYNILDDLYNKEIIIEISYKMLRQKVSKGFPFRDDRSCYILLVEISRSQLNNIENTANRIEEIKRFLEREKISYNLFLYALPLFTLWISSNNIPSLSTLVTDDQEFINNFSELCESIIIMKCITLTSIDFNLYTLFKKFCFIES